MKQLNTVLVALGLGFVAMQAQADATQAGAAGTGRAEWVYIGTHGAGGFGPGTAQTSGTPPSDARAQGIYAARLDIASGHLAPLGLSVELPRATWLMSHPTLPVLYSVADSGGGMQANSAIYSFGVDLTSGNLREINHVDAGGRDATALGLDMPSHSLLSANHGSGDLSALPLQSDGSLLPVASIQKDYGTGPQPRQKTPAAHGVAMDPTHRYALVADFGADRVFVYRFDGATRVLTPAEPPFVALPPGSGPRHLVFHPNGRFLFLDTELTAELRSYRWDARQGHLELVQSLSPYPATFSGEKSAAEIAVSSDGRFAYLSLRGDQDSLVVYAIDRKAGTLTEIQRVASQGKTPWSFGIDPTGRWMLVTNEASSAVAEFKIDRATGKLSATGESLSVPKPVTVAFVR